MTPTTDHTPGGFDPERDLMLTRRFDAPRELVWAAWRDPAHLAEWWCPKPVKFEIHSFDFRSGGAFGTTMTLPDGTRNTGNGIFAEVVPMERIVFTDAMEPGWRPVAAPFMTAVVTLADEAGGTRYTAWVLHPDAATKQKHEEMGFEHGWGIVFDQLGEFVRTLKEAA